MFPRVIGGVLLAVLCASAWQSSLGSLSLSEAVFHSAIQNYAFEAANRPDGELRLPNAGRAVTTALYSMSDEARAAVVKELGLAAKSFVLSPDFAAAYDDHIRQANNAVNHGIKVGDAEAEMQKATKAQNYEALQAAGENMMRDNFRKMAMEQIASADQLTADTIPIMVESFGSLLEMVPPRNAAEKANQSKAKSGMVEAAKLAPTDLAKAQATYRTALMLAVGIQDESQVANAKADDQKVEQQRNYNRLALRPNLKKKLQEFLAVAKTVDFKAATQAKGDRQVFVSPAFERKSGLWKMLYRLGPGGTKAAMDVAQGWVAEL